jgi:hypothetical protein
MQTHGPQPVLRGAKAFAASIANEHAMASGCAKVEVAERATLGELVDSMDVGFACAYLTTSTHHTQAYLDATGRLMGRKLKPP